MKNRKLLGRETACLHQRYPKRIGHRQRHRCAARRSQRKFIRLTLHAAIKNNIAVHGQGRTQITGQRDHRNVDALCVLNDLENFVCFTAVGQCNQDIVGRDNPEVTVNGLGGM